MDSLASSGTRIGNETITSVPAEAQIRPLRDQIIIEPLDWRPSRIIEVVHSNKVVRGRVKAVGPGCFPKKYDGPKGKRTKTWDSRAFLPTELRVGDIVELGGLEIGGYLHQTFRWGDKEHVICREADVAMVVE